MVQKLDNSKFVCPKTSNFNKNYASFDQKIQVLPKNRNFWSKMFGIVKILNWCTDFQTLKKYSTLKMPKKCPGPAIQLIQLIRILFEGFEV